MSRSFEIRINHGGEDKGAGYLAIDMKKKKDSSWEYSALVEFNQPSGNIKVLDICQGYEVVTHNLTKRNMDTAIRTWIAKYFYMNEGECRKAGVTKDG